jgi:hypothetical protein
VCAGHLHQPFVAIENGRTWVNAGSVARPMDGDPRGALAVVSRNRNGWSAETIRFDLPLDRVCQQIRASGMPYVERLCETQIQACAW